MIDLTTYREIPQAIRRHRDDSGILHAVALLDAEVGRLVHESARLANQQRLEIEALKARVAELDPPWTRTTDALPDYRIYDHYDIALVDGETRADLHFDGRFTDCDERVIFDVGEVAYWRIHVAPKRPDVPRETQEGEAEEAIRVAMNDGR